jgi:hypothetical protein
MTDNKTSNSFNSYKDEFKKDTGKNADENLELYALYVNTRLVDRSNVYLCKIITELVNLPRELREELKQVK